MINKLDVYDTPEARQRLLSLTEDFQQQKSEPLAGIDQWEISKHIDRELTSDQPASYTEMMPLWFGKAALKAVPASRISEYRDFLKDQINFERFDEIVIYLRDRNAGNLYEADLGLVFYFAFIEYMVATLKLNKASVIPVVEVGGGNGSAAELLVRFSKYKFHFCMVDAIPETMAYCESYLKINLPDVKVEMFGQNTLEITKPGFTIVPSWHAHELPDNAFKIGINVASIQEMPVDTAMAYVEFFKSKLQVGGKLFSANSRDFHCRQQYFLGDNFQLDYYEHSPRSRSLDYPIQILTYSDVSAKSESNYLSQSYLYKLADRLKDKVLDVEGKRKSQAEKAVATQKKLKEKIVSLTEQRDEYLQSIKSLKDNAGDKKLTKDAGYKARIEKLEQALSNKLNNEQSLKMKLAEQSKSYQLRIEQLEQSLSSTFDNENALKVKFADKDKAYQSRIEQLEKALSNKSDHEKSLKMKLADQSKSYQLRIEMLELALSKKVTNEAALKSKLLKLKDNAMSDQNSELAN